MKIKSLLLWSGFLLILLSGVYAGYSYLFKQKIDFKAERCNTDVNPMDRDIYGDDVVTKNAKYLPSGEWIVQGYVYLNCKAQTVNPSMSLKDNKVTLKYEVDNKEKEEGCECAHRLNYKISGLKQQNYSFALEGKE